MIPKIINEQLVPYKQRGTIKTFSRRKPEDSELLCENIKSMDDFYDHVRMLDGEGYPSAFLKFGSFEISFAKIEKKGENLVGNFTLRDPKRS